MAPRCLVRIVLRLAAVVALGGFGVAVRATAPEDVLGVEAETTLPRDCRVVNTSTIAYPFSFGMEGVDGTVAVLVRLTFSAPDQAPETKVLYRPPAGSRYASRVEKYVNGYRLSCTGEFKPVSALQVFQFKSEGEPNYGLGDVDLATFLRAVHKPAKQNARFDLTTMGCPFDVTLRLFQPYAKNVVREAGEPNPARREFLAWLRTLPLSLQSDSYHGVLGKTAKISVPCAVLDLT